MGKMNQNGLDIAWDLRCVDPVPEDDKNRNRRNLVKLNQPGYEAYTTFEENSAKQEGVVLSSVQSGMVRFVADVNVDSDQTSWRCGWLQTIRRAERSAQYDNNRSLFFRISSMPLRDEEDGTKWPFTCKSKKLTRGVYSLESSDSPIHYVPKFYPGSDESKLVSSAGGIDFLTVLACYREQDRRLIVLGGYQWRVDFAGTYAYDWMGRTKWTPAGSGFSVQQVAHSPAAIAAVRHRSGNEANRQYDDLRPPLYSLWGAQKMSLSTDGAADNMQESFDGRNWSKHRDHTTEEDKGKQQVAWQPSATALEKAKKSGGMAGNRSMLVEPRGFLAKRNGNNNNNNK
jgi:hypothetical protein